MTRPGRMMRAFVLAGAVCLVAGCEGKAASSVCGDGVCDPDEVCAADCSPCNNDGICDPGESRILCMYDCDGGCGANSTGPIHDVIVSELFLPTNSTEAAENGVDMDGDGEIDNRLGGRVTLLTANGFDEDINFLINEEIAAGRLLLLGRMQESGNSDGIVTVAFFRGQIHDATPVFEGNDSVAIHPDSDTNLYLCGMWADPDLETSPANMPYTHPYPGLEQLSLTLSAAQIRTVTDPENVYFGTSTVTEAGWSDVMVGGGLSEDEIQHKLIPFLTTYIEDVMTRDATAAETIADLFDGNCVVSEIPGCESVVQGQGECDNTLDPPVITETELRCNALLNSALAPDVDSDGDGEFDLLSLGFRIISAVPVTIVPQ